MGRFDEAAVGQAASRLLSGWKSATPYARVVTAYRPIEHINAKIETPDKENAQLSAALRLRMKDSDPDYAAMVMVNAMLGGTSLQGRLPQRIRNREGLSYSVSTSFSAPVEGDSAVLALSAIANPQNTPKVEASFMDELRRTIQGGFTAAEFEAAKKAWAESRAIGRSSDAGIMGQLDADEQYGRTLKWDADLDAKVQALTLDQVNAALRKYVNPDAFSIVKGGDFKKAGVYQ